MHDKPCNPFRYLLQLLVLPLLSGCGARANNTDKNMSHETEKIYFAGGCFWGTEHFMKQVDGVESTEVGYANSKVPNPTYREVCTGNTDAAETVMVEYDKDTTDLAWLIKLYFMTIDPTSVNRQGNDRGTQYRTGIYYTDDAQKAVAERELAKLAAEYGKPLAVEVMPLKNFYKAEDYHQDYLDKNPDGYCHLDPRLFEIARNARKPAVRRWIKPDDEELREKLTPLQYEVTQHSATEPPYANEYNDEYRKGIYVDITTGEPFFSSSQKFRSGCGWPSFSEPLPTANIVGKRDLSHGMVRTEVRSEAGDAHLGHVFNDGPEEGGGLRYCINSASLRFIPLADMEREGYGDWIKYVE